MTPLKFIIDPIYGCATSGEVMAYAKNDKAGFETLKQWAREEMANRGMAVEEPVAK